MKTDRKSELRLWAYGIVMSHLVFVVLHSIAHEVLGVKATPAQLAFIVPVIILAPVAAGILLPKYDRRAPMVLAAAMAGSFVFGVHYHFVANTIDHVDQVRQMHPGGWAEIFHVTAVLLTLTEAAGVFIAALLYSGRQPHLKAHAA